MFVKKKNLYKFSIFVFSILFFVLHFHAVSAATIVRSPNNTGLVGYWNFDIDAGGTNIIDLSGQGNDGTMTNMDSSTDWVDGKIGSGAMDFDGTDDKVDITSDIANDTGTISAWVKPNFAYNFGSPFSFHIFGTNSTTKRIQLDYDASGTSRFYFSYRGNYGTTITATGNTFTNNTDFQKWHHVLATWDAVSGMVSIYVDGVFEDSTSDTVTAWGDETDWSIGDNSGTNNDGTVWDGLIDDVRIYNRALSAEEIERLYKATAGTKINASRNNRLTDGLVGHWSFDGADVDWASNTAYDRSGQGNDGTFTNMSTTSAPTIGKIGQALDFDGSDDTVKMPIGALQVTSVTVSVWVKSSTTGSYDIALSWDSGSANPYHISVDGAGSKQIIFKINPSGGSLLLGEVVDVFGTWTHIVGTYNENTGNAYLYRNGIQVDSGSSSGAITYTIWGEQRLILGNDPSRGYYQGLIDDVRIYDRALLASEITRLYNMGR